MVRHIELCVKNEKSKEVFVMRNMQRSESFAAKITDNLAVVLLTDVPDLL